jgi:Terpene cyclase DEP1
VVGLASIALGYYFNYQFVQEYATPSSNPIWGPGSWQQFIALGYDNPAASSASQDYTIMSLLIFPVWAIVDGRRRGIKNAWLYIAFILFFSSASAWAFYLAAVERQRRHKVADVGLPSRA